MAKLIHIDAPHFCAALVPAGQCAPIIVYMRHWSIERIRAYCAKKRWRCEVREIIAIPAA